MTDIILLFILLFASITVAVSAVDNLYKKRKTGRIKKIWFDEYKGKVLMHVYDRSGVYYLPIKGGEQYSYWLVEYDMTMKLPKNETIYQLMDIRNKPPREETTEEYRQRLEREDQSEAKEEYD